MVIGMVKNISKGLIRAFKTARTAATAIPVKTESILTPGKIREVTIIARVLIIS
jgi:hypothetical protein